MGTSRTRSKRATRGSKKRKVVEVADAAMASQVAKTGKIGPPEWKAQLFSYPTSNSSSSSSSLPKHLAGPQPTERAALVGGHQIFLDCDEKAGNLGYPMLTRPKYVPSEKELRDIDEFYPKFPPPWNFNVRLPFRHAEVDWRQIDVPQISSHGGVWPLCPSCFRLCQVEEFFFVSQNRNLNAELSIFSNQFFQINFSNQLFSH